MCMTRPWLSPALRPRPAFTPRPPPAQKRPTASLSPWPTISAGCPKAPQARYFAGVTYEELGENGNAETELKSAAGSWNHNLSNLAKLALAGLYQQTNRDSEAVELYNELTAKPSVTVSAGVAQLDLADLYASEGKQDQARALWAKVKDADKDGAAGSIAAQKLAASRNARRELRRLGKIVPISREPRFGVRARLSIFFSACVW